MKKYYYILLFLLLSISFFSRAQNYYPLLDSVNVWTFYENGFRVKNIPDKETDCSYPYFPYAGVGNKMFTSGDTSINSTIYKILNAETWNGSCIYGYIREDTAARKVYFKDTLTNPEIVLYDFSMKLGDSLYVKFYPSTGWYYFSNAYYRLDSITTVQIHAGARKAFHLNCHNCNSYNTLTWIESVGNLGDPIYPYSINQPGAYFGWGCSTSTFPYDYAIFITCFDHSNKVYYDSCAFGQAKTNPCIGITDSCNYYNFCGRVSEKYPSTRLSLSPNPATDYITIHLETDSPNNFQLFITDLTGQTILKNIEPENISGNHSQKINLQNLPPGFYLLHYVNSRESVCQKLIKL